MEVQDVFLHAISVGQSISLKTLTTHIYSGLSVDTKTIKEQIYVPLLFLFYAVFTLNSGLF